MPGIFNAGTQKPASPDLPPEMSWEDSSSDLPTGLSWDGPPPLPTYGMVGQFLGHMSKSIADTADSLVTLLPSAASSLLSGGPFTQQGREMFSGGMQETPVSSLLDKIPGPRMSLVPTNTEERLAGSAGKTAGLAVQLVAPEAALGNLSLRTPAVLRQGASATEQALRGAVESTAANPANAAKIAALAGAGQGVVQQRVADLGAGPVTQALLGMVGGGVTSIYVTKISPTMWGAKLAGTTIKAAKALTDEGRQSLMGELAAKGDASLVGKSLSDPRFADNVALANALEKKLGFPPGSGFSVAAKTQDPALIKLESDLGNTATDTTLARMLQRKDAVAANINRFQTDNAPPAITDAPDRVLGGAASRVASAEAANAAEASALAGEVQGPTSAALGRDIRQKLEAASAQEKGTIQQYAEATGLNDRSTIFPRQPLDAAMQDIFGNEASVAESEAAAHLADIIKRNGPVLPQTGRPGTALVDSSGRPFAASSGRPDTLTLHQLQRTITDLNAEIRTVQSGNRLDKNISLYDLSRLKQAMTTYRDTVSPLNTDPGLMQNWTNFRGMWQKFANSFEQGTVYEALGPGLRKEYKTEAEDVAGLFFGPKNETGPTDFLKAGGSVSDLRRAALDSLNGAAVRDGALNPQLYSTWLRRHETSLKAAGLLDEFNNVATVGNNIGSRVNQLATRQAAVEDSALAKAVRASGGNPDTFVDTALKTPNAMASIVKDSRAGGTLPALRRAIWAKAFPDGGVTADGLAKFLKDNNRTLPIALTKEHIDALNTIQQAKALEELTSTPTGALPSGNGILSKVQETTGMGPMQMASRYVNVKSGRLSPFVTVADAVARFASASYRNINNKVLQEALVDEAFAKKLALSIKAGGKSKAINNQLRTHILLLGYPATPQDQNSSQ